MEFSIQFISIQFLNRFFYAYIWFVCVCVCVFTGVDVIEL